MSRISPLSLMVAAFLREECILAPREGLRAHVGVRPLGLAPRVVLLVGDSVEGEGEAGRDRWLEFFFFRRSRSKKEEKGLSERDDDDHFASLVFEVVPHSPASFLFAIA